MAKIMKAFRCDEILLTELEEYSSASHKTVSDVIRLSVFLYLSKMKRQESR